jgi:hypothetical protein
METPQYNGKYSKLVVTHMLSIIVIFCMIDAISCIHIYTEKKVYWSIVY